MSYAGPESTSTKGGAAMSHKDKAATAIMINQQQRISELVQKCEKLREERNTVRVKVEQPLLLRIRELRALVEEARGILIDSMLDEGYSDWMERTDKALEPPR